MSLRNHWMTGWIFLIGLVCLTGCKTTDQARSGHMASVEISGHTKNEIQKATVTAFLANGYLKTGGLTFEKKGSTWDTANYGGWFEDQVWIKIRAEIFLADTGKYTLGCNAFAVDGHGEVGMETEHKFLFARRTECKKILDEAKAALEAPAAAAETVNPRNP